jgi:hypothetical protein
VFKDMMAHRTQRVELNDRASAATYVAALSGDLALIARRHGLDTLGFLLEMAQMEAENETRMANMSD